MTTLQPETVRAWASNAAPAFLALYLISNLMLRSFTDVWMFVGWTALCSGVICGGWAKGRPTVFWGVLGLLFCHAAAIPGSLIWGAGNWELTAGVVLWMAPAMLLYLATNAHRVFVWLIPAFLLHAALVIVEGLTHWYIVGNVMVRQGTNTGLANNPNLAAGFLAIGIVYLMASKRPLFQALSLPLVVALLFTGSRWGILVPVAVIGVMALSGGGILALLLTVIGVGLMGDGYQIAGYGSIAGAFNPIVANVGDRLAVPHIPTFLPSGVAEHPGLHNVPLRIAMESGIIAAAIWVLITGWALLMFRKHPQEERAVYHDAKHYQYRPLRNDLPHDSIPHRTGITREIGRGKPQEQNNIHRWILLTLVLLSILDYYTWMGHLGGFWWLLIGLLTKNNYCRNTYRNDFHL